MNKVIQIVDSLDLGGTEMMSINIANGLHRNGVESHLCTTRTGGGLKSKLNKNVEYLCLERKKTFDLPAILALKKYVKENKINIIHAHHLSYFTASLVKMIYPKVKLIWHDHYGNSEFLNHRKKVPLNFFSRFFYSIISVNKKLKQWSLVNLNSSKVYYLPNFASLSDSSQKTALNGHNGKRIVCLAGFRPQKDHLTLLKAFKLVLEKHNDWTLHLIGNHYNDDCYQEIKLYIANNSLSNNIFLYHNATDIKYILSQTSIGVLSSISEGLPVSLLEYGLAKLPVVVTNVGETSTVLENGKYGLLVTPSDEKMLAESIHKLISNLDLRKVFSKEFEQHILKNFSEQKFIDKLLDIYKN